MANPLVDLVQGIHRFIDGLLATGRLAEQPSERRFVVTGTKPGGIGREIVGTITGGEADITGVIVTVGNGDVYHTGEEYEAAVTGGPANMKVRLGIRLNSQNPPRGANMFAALPAPIVSTVTNPDDGFDNPIGLYTEEDLNSATGANGEPFALLRLFYRLIVPGVYSVYKDFLQYVQVQVRPVAAENWRNVPSQVITPSRLLRISTAAAVSASTAAIPVTLPADLTPGDLFLGHYVHWRIEAETLIAKLAAGPTARSIVSAGSATTDSPTVTVFGGGFSATDNGARIIIGNVGVGGGTYTGVITSVVDASTITVSPNPSVTAGGQNVTITPLALTVLGRGVDGSTAAAHANGSGVELLTGMATVGGLEPGVETAVRAAFVDIHNVAGPASVVNVLTTWKRTFIPGLSNADTAHLQFKVDLQRNGWHLTWTRPKLPDGTVYTGRLNYRIWQQRLAAGLSLVGARVVADTMNFSADIPVTDWPDPATRADAKLFAIQPYDSFGNVATTGGQANNGYLWETDNVPSPNPDPATVKIEPSTGAVVVTVGDAAPVSDPGFSHYELWQASTDAFGDILGAHPVAQFGELATSLSWPFDDYGVVYLYQVISVDLAGNETPVVMDLTHWKYCPSLGLSDRMPYNGNFQIPNNDQSLPVAWVFGQGVAHQPVGGAAAPEYAAVGGLKGNRVMRMAIAAGSPRPQVILWVESIHPYYLNPGQSVTAKWWFYAPQSGITWDAQFDVFFFSDDAGTVPAGSVLSYSDTATGTTVAGWQQITITTSIPGVNSDVKSMRFGFGTAIESQTIGAGYYIQVDDVSVTQP